MLPATDPVISVARPPLPVVMAGLPLNTMLPPVAVPAALATPALSSTALLLASTVATLCATVRSPLAVPTYTGPLAPMPLTPSTLPICMALLF